MAFSRDWRYRMTSGFTYASRAVVEDRSNSRNSASTSWLVETGRPESAFATRRSCAGWRNEKRRETATDSAPLDRTFRARFFKSRFVGARQRRPRAAARSASQKAISLGAAGGGR